MPKRDLSHLPFILYGGDYNPEQWPEHVWREDVALMREAGVNIVSLGIFSWAKLEPRPGQYEFGWLDELMHLLHDNGIAVDLATATASPPAWMARLYPDSLPVTRNGTRLAFGGRQQYSPHSAAYREHAAALVEQLARRYAGHPGLAMWHINNEYGCHVSECFSEAGAQAFRAWLRRKYAGIDALNEAWGTAFWSQTRSDWDEIDPPREAPTFVNPAMQLDWRRFSSDALLDLMKMEVEILRRYTPDVPVTTNFMSFFKPLDYFAWAESEDVVSQDAYPDPSSYDDFVDNAMACDLMRSLKPGTPWLMMEQATSAVNWRRRNSPKRPGQMRAQCLQALARGARGLLFFQWRQSRAGAEKFHSALVPHGGQDTRVWREVVRLGRDLRALAPIHAAPVRAETAILFDWNNWWAMELDSHPSADLKLMDLVRAFYRPLFAKNVPVDFAQPGKDLSQYKLVIAPNLYLTRHEDAARLEAFVAAGGIAVVAPFSGVVDDCDRAYLGGYPGPLRSLLGIRVEEFVPLQEHENNTVVTLDEEAFGCGGWSEVIHAEGAQPLAVFASDYVGGQPAVTRNAVGRGAAYYVGAQLDPGGIEWVLSRAMRDAGMLPGPPTPPGVEARLRGDWLFLINHTATEQRVPSAGGLRDVATGARWGDEVILAPFDGCVLSS